MKNVEEPGSSINELGSLFSIQTANISKSFSGTTVLDDINLELKSGEIHGMVGQNGAGKSTLGKIIGGYHPSSKGKLILNNKEILSLIHI